MKIENKNEKNNAQSHYYVNVELRMILAIFIIRQCMRVRIYSLRLSKILIIMKIDNVINYLSK